MLQSFTDEEAETEKDRHAAAAKLKEEPIKDEEGKVIFSPHLHVLVGVTCLIATVSLWRLANGLCIESECVYQVGYNAQI